MLAQWRLRHNTEVPTPLSGGDHIGIAAPTTGTDEPLMPIGNGRLGAVSSRHFGGIRLDLMAALPAPGEAVWLPEGPPHDQAHMGSRRVAERHRRAGIFGLHSSLFVGCSEAATP
jgi:hypothetical protein